MVLADVMTLASLLSLGSIIGAAALLRLSRLDRLRWEYMRQDACRWHRWQVLKGGGLVDLYPLRQEKSPA